VADGTETVDVVLVLYTGGLGVALCGVLPDCVAPFGAAPGDIAPCSVASVVFRQVVFQRMVLQEVMLLLMLSQAVLSEVVLLSILRKCLDVEDATPGGALPGARCYQVCCTRWCFCRVAMHYRLCFVRWFCCCWVAPDVGDKPGGFATGNSTR
jgi:hypothetical protein